MMYIREYDTSKNNEEEGMYFCTYMGQEREEQRASDFSSEEVSDHFARGDPDGMVDRDEVKCRGERIREAEGHHGRNPPLS